MDLLGAYVVFLGRKGLRESTVREYLSDLLGAHAVLTEAGATLEQPDDQGLRALCDGLRKLAPATLRRRLASLRGFYRFMNHADALAAIDAIPAPKQRRPRRLDVPVERLLAAPGERAARDPHHRVRSIRDTALLRVLYELGIPASAVAMIALDQVDLQTGTVAGHLVETATVEALRAYLAGPRYELHNKRCGALFVAWNGALSRQGIWKLVKAYARSCGIKATPHTFVHAKRRRMELADEPRPATVRA